MRRSLPSDLLAAGLTLALVLHGGGARAQAPADAAAIAEALYNDAKKLFLAGDYTAACPKFAESVRLDPAPGAKNALAHCYQRIGRVASAWSLYRDVVAEAGLKGDKKRADAARKAADELEPTLPKLSITVADAAAGVPGLEIKRDSIGVGKVQWGVALPVDPGEHLVVATAPGRAPWETRVVVTAAASATVSVPALPAASNARRTASIALTAAGAAGLVAGAVLGGVAAARWGNAKALAKDGGCADAAHFTGCSADAVDAQKGALGLATGSTAALVAGSVLAAAGVVVWATAPRSSRASSGAMSATGQVWIAPSVGPASSGVTVGGAF